MIFLRGREITGRHITAYEQELKFNRRILSGKRVLNFGSGKSSLKQDIEKMNQTLDKRVSTQITEVDINFLDCCLGWYKIYHSFLFFEFDF